jgi:hypothetical protein
VLSFRSVERAYNQVRRELEDCGLLADGVYLDHIECEQTLLPSWDDELGFVFDEGVPWHRWLVGFRAGVIYIPRNCPARAHVPGETLLDTMRHEFAHAWAAYDPLYFRKRWFREAFGLGYFDEWDDPPAFDRWNFVSSYACSRPREDFAETFMVFLRSRRSLVRFRTLPGLYAKLRAVEAAVFSAAKERVHRRRLR